MQGSDGDDYVFLLKGHEDLRQDERVMQLFGLVNVLLNSDRTTSKRDLSISRYSVIPLSSNAGVVYTRRKHKIDPPFKHRTREGEEVTHLAP